MSKEKSKKRHHRKHRTVLPYLTTSIIYVLISMIVVVPVLAGGLHYAVGAVHKAQNTLSIDYNDISISDNKDALCSYVGTVKCARIGLSSDAYVGNNRVSYRNGCGAVTKGNIISMAGYTNGAFKPLLKAELGDIIEYNGAKYEVVNISDNKDYSYNDSDSYLVLCTTGDTAPFTYYSGDKLYVVAKEVQ